MNLVSKFKILYLKFINTSKSTTLSSWVCLFFLSVLSFIYKSVILFKNFLYEYKILNEKKLICKVISVGNLVVGGTGKTPLTKKLAKYFLKRKINVAIITRGYKRSFTIFPKTIVFENELGKLHWYECGDEPCMLAEELPGIPIIIDKNRIRGGKYAIKNFGSQLIILDDGFSYRRLFRDVNILILNSIRPFDNGYCLPRGLLREPISALKRADIILLSKSEVNPNLEIVKKEIKKYNLKAPIFTMTYEPLWLLSLNGCEMLPLKVLKDQKIVALSGIGDPSYFELLLKKLGADVAVSYRFPDHHFYSESELKEIVQKGLENDCKIFITTYKDAVKLRELKSFPSSLLFLILIVETKVEKGFFEYLNVLLQKN